MKRGKATEWRDQRGGEDLSEGMARVGKRADKTAEWLRSRRRPARIVYWSIASAALLGLALGAIGSLNARFDFFLEHREVFVALTAVALSIALLAGGRSLWHGVAGFAVLAASAGLVLGAFGAADERLDLLANFRGHFALIALIAAALAALSGGRRLAVGAALIGALGLAALWPVWRAQPAVAASCGVERLRIVTANLYIANKSPAEAAAALLALEADIMATQETGDAFWAEADALRARYPYRLEQHRARIGSRSAMLWSTLPLSSGIVAFRDADAPTRALAEITVGGRSLGLASLHVSWPALGGQARQIEGLDRTLASLPIDRIVMGDFNAAPWSHAMAVAEQTIGARMASGLRLTWRGGYPNPLRRYYTLSSRLRRSIPAPLGHHIDQILVSPGIGVAQVRAVDLPGSDHRAVVAEIEIPRACGG